MLAHDSRIIIVFRVVNSRLPTPNSLDTQTAFSSTPPVLNSLSLFFDE